MIVKIEIASSEREQWEFTINDSSTDRVREELKPLLRSMVRRADLVMKNGLIVKSRYGVTQRRLTDLEWEELL